MIDSDKWQEAVRRYSRAKTARIAIIAGCAVVAVIVIARTVAAVAGCG